MKSDIHIRDEGTNNIKGELTFNIQAHTDTEIILFGSSIKHLPQDNPVKIRNRIIAVKSAEVKLAQGSHYALRTQIIQYPLMAIGMKLFSHTPGQFENPLHFMREWCTGEKYHQVFQPLNHLQKIGDSDADGVFLGEKNFKMLIDSSLYIKFKMLKGYD
ncbi:MAG TPA: hypothetical protein ENH82_16550, partial [bacterium]|nr:hypothetical protein [bacterium]